MPPDQTLPELSLASLQALFDARTGRGDIALSDARWIVSHRPNPRLVEAMRDGPVFLVGDAAHSPPTLPGQGLNLSIQDAYNLGWKLAAVIGGANPDLLDSYQDERRPIAAAVLGVLVSELIAKGMSPEAAQERQRRIRDDIFHLDHDYRDSALNGAPRQAAGAVAAGDRAPDGLITDMAGRVVRLFDLLRGPHLTMLNFVSGPTDPAAAIAPAPGLRVVVILPSAANHVIRKTYGVAGAAPAYLLIRPDGYVGVRSDRVRDLQDWLHRVFSGPH